MKIKCGINRTEANTACMLKNQVPFVENWDGISLPNSVKCGRKKRGLQMELDDRDTKRQRMDQLMTIHCSKILAQLMNHPAGWIFNQPVDPIALEIHDYFHIISEPMDLGTVKDKLQKNMYSSPENFASDVRLTFSNAMLYNPPQNSVHIYAKQLSNVFESKWERVEGKGVQSSSGASQRQKLSRQKTENFESVENIHKRSPSHGCFPRKMFMVSGKVKTTETAKLKKVESPKTPKICIYGSEENPLKGIGVGGKHDCVLANAKQQLKPVASKRSVRISSSSQSILSQDSNRTLSTDTTLRRNLSSFSHKDSKQDCHSRSLSAAKLSKSNLDCDLGTSVSGNKRLCSNNQVHSLSADDGLIKEYIPIYLIPLSPSKALRAAMLKSRFVETILKARQKLCVDNVHKEDSEKLRQEKERLERLQHEEKVSIEEQIKASKAAAKRMEIERQQQRQKDRDAARRALEKMKRTVFINDNLDMLKELEMLSGCSLSYHRCRFLSSSWAFQNPLEKLGVYIKDDYLFNEDEESEEGEILQ